MLVTHDVQLVMALSDRTLVIAAGGIRAEGTPSTLERSSDPLVRPLYARGH